MNKKEIEKIVEEHMQDYLHKYCYVEYKKGKEVSAGNLMAGSYKHAAKKLFKSNDVEDVYNSIENRKLHTFLIKSNEGCIVDYTQKLFKKN